MQYGWYVNKAWKNAIMQILLEIIIYSENKKCFCKIGGTEHPRYKSVFICMFFFPVPAPTLAKVACV